MKGGISGEVPTTPAPDDEEEPGLRSSDCRTAREKRHPRRRTEVRQPYRVASLAGVAVVAFIS
jgi:hypothetical protein